MSFLDNSGDIILDAVLMFLQQEALIRIYQSYKLLVLKHLLITDLL